MVQKALRHRLNTAVKNHEGDPQSLITSKSLLIIEKLCTMELSKTLTELRRNKQKKNIL